MKIEILKPGKQFKNYKVMCQELGIEVKKSSNTKDAQFKELKRYCTFNKVGHLITIDQVYKTPLEKKKRKGNNAVYLPILQKILLHNIATKQTPVSTIELIAESKMCNSMFRAYFAQKRKLAFLDHLEEKNVFYFFENCHMTLMGAINRCIDYLIKKETIFLESTSIRIREFRSNKSRLATAADIAIIEKIEEDLTSRYGESASYRYNSEYRSEMLEKLKELLNARYYFKTSLFKFVDNDTADDYILSEKELDELSTKLNLITCKRLFKNSQRNKSIRKCTIPKTDLTHLITKLVAVKKNKNWFERLGEDFENNEYQFKNASSN